MARKFQIGDVVEVVSGSFGNFNVGRRGKVVAYHSSARYYPYVIRRRGGFDGGFAARELKLVRRKNE